MRWALFTFAVVAYADEFEAHIRPVLVENCAKCHTKGPAPFLKANTAAEMEANRGLWHNVASQLRNRTMPPGAAKLSEEDRFQVSSWIDSTLRQTACGMGEFAGNAVTRRLNRREYRNTVRDLLGVDLDITSVLPADGTGGNGFDTNGETLYLPPALTERYMEAAQGILDRAIVTPLYARTVPAGQPVTVPSYGDFQFNLRLRYDIPTAAQLTLKVDGVDAGKLRTPPRRVTYGKEEPGPLNGVIQVTLSRGTHVLTVESDKLLPSAATLNISQKEAVPSLEKRALHYRIFGIEPGEQPIDARRAASQILEQFLPKAFRRPVTAPEVDRFLALYDRAAERGDPYEERVKLALKAVLVWPDFLFRVEQKPKAVGIYPLSQYELATRLSYFLWSTAPDQTLTTLAAQGALSDPKVLAAQTDRMLDDPRSRAFLSSFMGQWLGTQDIGGRVVPLLTELQSYYTPETAADLRAQPVLLLGRILAENRSLTELLTADYMYMTERLAKFYDVEKQMPGLSDTEFKLVHWPDDKRAGILGLGGVLAMTSRYKETSPVLRGAWVLDTMLGTPVPPPPADVPALKTDAELGHKLPIREKLAEHRSNPSCTACHKMMDPIGFGLESYDWMGRWRDKDNGKPIDASGELPTGEKFNGPVELRQALLNRKSEFIGNLSAKVLGYALGRSLQDGDSCTVQKIADALEKDDYRARTLIREIVLSVPFRNTQGGVAAAEPLITQRGTNFLNVNAAKQDADSHNNGVKLKAK